DRVPGLGARRADLAVRSQRDPRGVRAGGRGGVGPRACVTADAGADFVVALDFGGAKIALAAAGLDGAHLAQRRIGREAGQGAAAVVRRALAAAAALVEGAAARCGGRCRGAGAVTPGVIREDGIALAPALPGWERLRLVDELREGLDLERVAVANDVKA